MRGRHQQFSARHIKGLKVASVCHLNP